MKNDTKQPIYKKWWVWLIAVVMLFSFIAVIMPDAPMDEQPLRKPSNKSVEKQDSEPTTEAPEEIQEDSYELAGFTLYFIQDYEDGSATASYNPNAFENYSLTAAIGGELLGHEDRYTLERQTQTIEEVSVSTGYTDDDVQDGLQLETAYRSLAFDFTVNETNYSGEISNLLGEGAKDDTMDILTTFVTSLIAE